MFICLDEDHVFDEPKHYIETHGQDCPPYEEYDGCPICAGAFEEAEQCEGCGKWFPLCEQEEDEASHARLCSSCMADEGGTW